MPRVSTVYAGDYIQAAQIPPGRHPVMIVNAIQEEIGQDRDMKIVLSLARATDRAPWPKGCVLNKTNALILASAYGDETNDWIGRVIEIWREPVQFQGRVVQGIRLAPYNATAAGAGIPGALPAGGGDAQGGNGAVPPTQPPPAPTMQVGPTTNIPLPTAATGQAYAGPGSSLDDEIPF
jgi:hypothetical protein